MKVVVADANLVPQRSVLESHVPDGAVIVWVDATDDGALLAELPDADVLVGPRFTAAMGASAPRLRLVHVAGAGYDGIDLTELPTGAVCANTFHHEESIAEYVAASLVVLRRGLLRQDSALRRGVWSSSVYDPAIAPARTLDGAVVTFLGFGHIGAAAWRLLQAFGAEGIAITRTGHVDAHALNLRRSADATGLHAALAESDVLVVSVPLRPETTGIIARRELTLLGPSGLLVNVARGPVVEERDLFAAVKDGTIGGAALDVWYRYPAADGHAEPASEPFWLLDNVLMTPHSSGVTANTFRARALDIADNIVRLHEGRPLNNVVGGEVRRP
ncbi:MAG TPA: 2-hydroxyacid dehydrogenase [Cellulomonadaceae bacterium]|nr:2-hydroxyacid dehydrogenase [Cellulomonadaceae bacterium]